MNTYMIIARFKPDTNMTEVMAVVSEERAQVQVLKQEGRFGASYISQARGTVFIEIFAPDAAAAEATVRTLPMSRWWDTDVYPIAPPVPPAAA